MARYQHLPIFQDVYDLNLEIHRRVENFPRAHRYCLGERLKNMTLDMLSFVMSANSSREKFAILSDLENSLDIFRIHLRLCFDMKILGNSGFEFLVKKLDEIGRQTHGWKEWSNSGTKSPIGDLVPRPLVS